MICDEWVCCWGGTKGPDHVVWSYQQRVEAHMTPGPLHGIEDNNSASCNLFVSDLGVGVERDSLK
ncbi:hypothetical protein SESBI_00089 [Sesbania bispinosa]|nr:hypothetical protein SESBI_00089 [Sesbania bispinosa]